MARPISETTLHKYLNVLRKIKELLDSNTGKKFTSFTQLRKWIFNEEDDEYHVNGILYTFLKTSGLVKINDEGNLIWGSDVAPNVKTAEGVITALRAIGAQYPKKNRVKKQPVAEEEVAEKAEEEPQAAEMPKEEEQLHNGLLMDLSFISQLIMAKRASIERAVRRKMVTIKRPGGLVIEVPEGVSITVDEAGILTVG